MSQPVTIKDLAEELGLHFTTVSCALRGSGTISGATRERVLDAAKRMDYRPNRLAQATRSGKSQTLGLVLGGDFEKSALQLRKIEQHAWDSGYHVLVGHGLANVQLASSAEILERELQQVERLAGYRIDGLVIQSALTYARPEDRQTFWQQVQRIHRSGTPVVVFDCLCEVDLPQVLVDRRILGAEVAKFLRGRGYTRALYAGSTQTFQSKRIFGGLLSVDRFDAVPFELDVTDRRSVAEGFRVAEHWATLDDRPEVIIAANPRIAHGLINQLLVRGFDVPGDVSLLSLGESEMLHWPPMPICSFGSSSDALAENAWLLLEKQWSGEATVKSVSLDFYPTDGDTLQRPESSKTSSGETGAANEA